MLLPEFVFVFLCVCCCSIVVFVVIMLVTKAASNDFLTHLETFYLTSKFNWIPPPPPPPLFFIKKNHITSQALKYLYQFNVIIKHTRNIFLGVIFVFVLFFFSFLSLNCSLLSKSSYSPFLE